MSVNISELTLNSTLMSGVQPFGINTDSIFDSVNNVSMSSYTNVFQNTTDVLSLDSEDNAKINITEWMIPPERKYWQVCSC